MRSFYINFFLKWRQTHHQKPASYNSTNSPLMHEWFFFKNTVFLATLSPEMLHYFTLRKAKLTFSLFLQILQAAWFCLFGHTDFLQHWANAGKLVHITESQLHKRHDQPWFKAIRRLSKSSLFSHRGSCMFLLLVISGMTWRGKDRRDWKVWRSPSLEGTSLRYCLWGTEPVLWPLIIDVLIPFF